jgi:hypothetical protein
MDDIVAIKIRTTDKRSHFVLTWGRLFDKIDDNKLLSVVSSNLDRFGITPKKVELCESLQEASQAKYFYEGFFKISQEKIPFGLTYKKWVARKRKLLRKGKDIYYLGTS